MDDYFRVARLQSYFRSLVLKGCRVKRVFEGSLLWNLSLSEYKLDLCKLNVSLVIMIVIKAFVE